MAGLLAFCLRYGRREKGMGCSGNSEESRSKFSIGVSAIEGADATEVFLVTRYDVGEGYRLFVHGSSRQSGGRRIGLEGFCS